MIAVKDAVLELAAQLPIDCTWDEVMDRLYVRQKIVQGLRDVEEGRWVDHDEFFREFGDDSHPVD